LGENPKVKSNFNHLTDCTSAWKDDHDIALRIVVPTDKQYGGRNKVIIFGANNLTQK
jgi:hypothetical protein